MFGSYRIVISFGLLAAIGSVGCGSEVAGGSTDGAKIFQSACATCHGPKGSPDPGMRSKLGVRDLTDAAVQDRLSDDDIRRQVRQGSANKKMPAFGDRITGEQLDALVRHIRTLRAAEAQR